MIIVSPLEQFQILSLLTIEIFGFDFSITNALLVNLLALLCFSGTIYFFSSNTNCLNKSSFFFIPNPWQVIFESIYDVVSQLVFDLVSTGSEKYFPFITVIFSFILFNNLIGLVPYSFTITSHLIITFTLSFSIFIGLNIICYQRHSIHMFSLFLPANTTFFLALLLVPIEFVSYIAKPISLGVRLFINLMAGHSLLKVIVGFAWSMMLLEGLQSLSFLIPLLVLTLLMGLELGVAIIQAYVFITLTCIYLNESEILETSYSKMKKISLKKKMINDYFLVNNGFVLKEDPFPKTSIIYSLLLGFFLVRCSLFFFDVRFSSYFTRIVFISVTGYFFSLLLFVLSYLSFRYCCNYKNRKANIFLNKLVLQASPHVIGKLGEYLEFNKDHLSGKIFVCWPGTYVEPPTNTSDSVGSLHKKVLSRKLPDILSPEQMLLVQKELEELEVKIKELKKRNIGLNRDPKCTTNPKD